MSHKTTVRLVLSLIFSIWLMHFAYHVYWTDSHFFENITEFRHHGETQLIPKTATILTKGVNHEVHITFEEEGAEHYLYFYRVESQLFAYYFKRYLLEGGNFQRPRCIVSAVEELGDRELCVKDRISFGDISNLPMHPYTDVLKRNGYPDTLLGHFEDSSTFELVFKK